MGRYFVRFLIFRQTAAGRIWSSRFGSGQEAVGFDSSLCFWHQLAPEFAGKPGEPGGKCFWRQNLRANLRTKFRGEIVRSELPRNLFFTIISFLDSVQLAHSVQIAIPKEFAGVVQRLVQRPSKPWMRVRFPSPAFIVIFSQIPVFTRGLGDLGVMSSFGWVNLADDQDS